MLYLLDTSSFSLAMRDNPGIIARMRELSVDDDVVICTIVRGEILFGINRLPSGRRRDHLAARAARLLGEVECHSVPPAAAEPYAQLKYDSQARGRRIDENDLWIAATAINLSAALVSADSDLHGIEGLRAVNWSA